MWNSETYGKLSLSMIPEKLKLFYERNSVYGEPMEITIGTDSQNHSSGTKIVTVISIICKGHGGIFFYKTEFRDLISVVREKLETETYISLETAKALLDELDNDEYRVLIDNCPFSIHIDAGNAPHGKTRDLIQALTGWVHAMGYECEVKPDSYTASTIADRISK
ncbi:MAG: hypothetical protein IJH43_06785 [Mogibacterium sp.]|nr:hypothetical protein [Mogibacterium sp.]